MINKSIHKSLPGRTATLEEWESYNPPNWINSIVKRMAMVKLKKEKEWFKMRDTETTSEYYKRVGIKYSQNEKTKGETTLIMSCRILAISDEKDDDSAETMVRNLNRKR